MTNHMHRVEGMSDDEVEARMTEDHTDKSLLERADEVQRRLKRHDHPPGNMLERTCRVCELEDDAAQVISDLKTALQGAEEALESVQTARPDEIAWSDMQLKRAEAAEARADSFYRQLKQQLGHRMQLRDELSSAQATIDSLRQDLDRISAEREAYREFIEEVAAQKNTTTIQNSAGTGSTVHAAPTNLAEQARRILAENDR